MASQCRMLCVFVACSLAAVFTCEYLIYYLKLVTCTWPNLHEESKNSNTMVKALVLSDPHLIGYIRGHPLDRLRRHWQMKQAFRAALFLHRPDVVFILGDLFDEGQWAPPEHFSLTVVEYKRIFEHDPANVVLKNVVGNHDIGFHDYTNYYLDRRFKYHFTPRMNTSAVRLWIYHNVQFVIANSMSFEADGCPLCLEAERDLDGIGRYLERHREAMPMDKKMVDSLPLPYFADPDSEALPLSFSRPILLQHFPLFRRSEADCPHDIDAPPPDSRNKSYKPKLDCLSYSASQKLLRTLKPRLVLSGHAHHSCRLDHIVDDGSEEYSVPEWSVASFSWRNIKNPTFLLLTISQTSHMIEKCFLPSEGVIITLYIVGFLATILLTLHARSS